MKIVKSWNISLSYKNNIFQIYFYISLLLINLLLLLVNWKITIKIL